MAEESGELCRGQGSFLTCSYESVGRSLPLTSCKAIGHLPRGLGVHALGNAFLSLSGAG